MFKVFYQSNPLSYIEYLFLFILFIGLFIQKRAILARIYVYQFKTIVKAGILVTTFVACLFLYITLAMLSTYWYINVAINALLSSIVLFLIVSLFFKKAESQ